MHVLWRSPQYVAPATYIIGVYGRTETDFTLVVTSEANTVIDLIEGDPMSGRIVPVIQTVPVCNYYR